jgi:hypothetical protein
MLSRKQKRLLIGILVPLYLATWVGGWISHAGQLQANTEARYRAAKHRSEEYEAEARNHGERVPIFARVHEGGPSSGVSWCVPILPGVLLADSYSSVGPLNAQGGLKVVLWYGVGSVELCCLVCWVA